MARGGKRAGAGRKKMSPPTKGRTIRLTDAQAKLLRMWGRGDMSAGLRWLIDQAAPLIRKTGEVDQARSTPRGCCERNANNMACDCAR